VGQVYKRSAKKINLHENMYKLIPRDIDFLYKESDYGQTEHYAILAKRDPEKGENARR
jgi:hypothetical protein